MLEVSFGGKKRKERKETRFPFNFHFHSSSTEMLIQPNSLSLPLGIVYEMQAVNLEVLNVRQQLINLSVNSENAWEIFQV